MVEKYKIDVENHKVTTMNLLEEIRLKKLEIKKLCNDTDEIIHQNINGKLYVGSYYYYYYYCYYQ